MRIFRILFGWLLNRWVVSFLGLALLASLVWFLGPLIAFGGREPLASTEARLVAIIVIVLIWAIKTIWTLVRAKQTNDQVIDGLVAAPEDAAEDQTSQEELAILRDRFRDSLAVLKKARLGGRGRRRQLYQLPWYLIIGPPGAGKTTALKNSGLKFPLAERTGGEDVRVRGMGGTRNCDWWFTDEAVLLDTAGRYTTQDSDQAVDRAAWIGFLQLLKKHRRRRPVDGVIVAFSLDDLAQHGGEERRLHAVAVRQRLQELANELKVRVPVYVVLTKCDLIAGFIEFFDDLGREERGQVWGLTFPIAQSEDPAGVIDAFGAEYDAVMERLDGRLIARLDQERDLNRRGAILGFTQQMAALKGSIQDFLAETFQPTRFEEPCLLRGIYFSSGTQEGTPIDRVISSISGTFGLDRQAMPAFSGPGRSYFLTRLLREVVFQEADLVGQTGLLHRHRAWFQRAAYAGAALLVILMAAAWTTSYLGNQDYIAGVEARVSNYERMAETLAAGSGSVEEMLAPLDALRALPGGYDDQDKSVPILLGFGLYQGDKLGEAARSAYRRALHTVLLPRVMEGLESQMRRNVERPEALYEVLKTYLMMGNPKVLDRQFVQTLVAIDWSNRLPGAANEAPRDQFRAHLAALLEGDMVPPPLDSNLVLQAREFLAQRPLAERVYGQVKREARQSGLEDWRVTDKIGDGARYFRRRSGELLTKGLPGLFTYDGYKNGFLVKLPELAQVAADEAWVIGSEHSQALGETDLPALKRYVEELYFAEYVRQWETYLADVDIVRFKGFDQAADAMNVLSGVDSPIKKFLIAVSEETTLTKTPIDTGATAEGADKLKDRLSRLLDIAPEAGARTTDLDPAGVVDRRFERIHALVEGSSDSPPPVDRVLNTLNDLYIHLSTARTGGIKLAPPGTVDAIGRTRLEAERQPEPLAAWLRGLARESSAVTVGSVMRRLNDIWASEIAPYCRHALANRYPLVKDSPQDANLTDFSRFFGPQGMVDTFFSQHLRPYVDTTSRPWQPLSSGGVKIGISESTLSQFEAAARIKDAFFAGGGAEPKVLFQIRPLALDKSASQVLWELGEQRLTYRHGPQRLQTMQWPPPSGSSRARIVFTSLGGAQPASLSADGPWALFRLLDKARMGQTTMSDRFKMTFNVEGLTAIFELRASSVSNPFRLSIIRGFRCLGSL
jgi:type VI secretion system protein ImpL